jgi:hypothetical protein
MFLAPFSNFLFFLLDEFFLIVVISDWCAIK